MEEFFSIVHVLVSLGLIGLVLIQHGKGADAGAAFGSGASATVFGSQGSGNFLTRITAILAASFFVTSLLLAYFSAQKHEPESVIAAPVAEQSAPAAPASDVPSLPTAPAVAQEKAAEEVPAAPVPAPAE